MLAATLWWLSGLPEARRFWRSTTQVAATQDRYLRDLWQRNQSCDYFRHYGVRRYQDLRDHLPLIHYADVEPWVERVAGGQQNVLCCEPVKLFEPTSGTQAVKLIPYTATLKREFQRGLAAWIGDLYAGKPALLRGRAYWSITPPPQRPQRTLGGIPIGFEDDAAYLSRSNQWLVRRLLAVSQAGDLDETLEQLLHCQDLSLVSVWSPTFWLLLLERLRQNWHRWAQRDALKARMRRAERHGLSALWPRLQLLSCWGDGPSQRFLPALRADFPDLFIQPKGLLATEALLSFPLLGREGAALSLRSHFFEFLDEQGRVYLAHELSVKQTYEVVISTGGGLYRYRLGDRVQVTGFVNDCPLLRFLGRTGLVSDHFGEKLSAEAVESWLPAARGPCFVAFEDGGYVLYAEGDQRTTVVEGEHHLCKYHHYRLCRQLGQLRPLRAYRLLDPSWDFFYRRLQSLGRRGGEVKPLALRCEENWSEHLPGRFVSGDCRDAASPPA